MGIDQWLRSAESKLFTLSILNMGSLNNLTTSAGHCWSVVKYYAPPKGNPATRISNDCGF